MRLTALIALLLVACAGPVAAKEVDPQAVRDCYESAAEGERKPACLGRAAEVCQIPGYESSDGVMACIAAETAVWEDILTARYRTLSRGLRARGPDVQVALRDAQLAWVAYRDAECGLARALWGDGEFRVVIAAQCRLIETAERAFELRDKKGL